MDLPWFGGQVAAILRRRALAHHCGHVNLKIFGDILYVWLGEAHSTWQQNEPDIWMLYIYFNLHCKRASRSLFAWLFVFYLLLYASGQWGVFFPWSVSGGTASSSAGGTPLLSRH